jgi:hypothetical protein
MEIMKNSLITKDLFLTALQCPTMGWHETHLSSPKPMSIYDKFIIEEGLEIHKKAHHLFPDGHLITGDNITATNETAQLLDDPDVSTLFEATFMIDNGITKADIIKIHYSGVDLIEVKSGLDPKEDYLNDLAYTTMVCKQAGLPITTCSLLLLNRDYRHGMPVSALFKEADCTEDIMRRSDLFWSQYDAIIKKVFCGKKLPPDYKFECKNCDYLDTCLKNNHEYHIFDLPRLSHTKFCRLRELGIESINDIPADFGLSPSQEKVREAIRTKTPYIDKKGLIEELGQLVYPLHFLDFETVTTAIPLYEDISPYTQIPTQYSLHVCSETGDIVHHYEYLSDSHKDGRRKLAETLIGHCGSEGSLFCYSSFEKTVINGLISLFPDLTEELGGLVSRLVDLCAILKRIYYHPDFHGSYSIKTVLPVMAPELSYDNMEISNGSDAVAQFAYLARGKYSKKEVKAVRSSLLEYCELDTLAMVKVWERLKEMV